MKVAIVGAGPRGTGILERLVARAATDPRPVHIDLVDPYSPGAGRIWRKDQDTLLWMNSVAADVAMFTDPTSSVSSPVDPGPTLGEWVVAHREKLSAMPDISSEVERFTTTSFASRTLHSYYLAWVFDRALAAAPEHVSIEVHRATVLDIVDDGDRQVLTLDDGTTLHADSVVLAQGHPDSSESEREKTLRSYALENNLVYVGPGYTADLDPSPVPEGEPVLVAGIGLAFVDWMVLLAESRGGLFYREPSGSLSYTHSGREPVLYVGSRRGVPYHAKISYSIADARPPLPRYFVPAAFPGTDTLDFRTQVWPLASKELAGAHYYELFRSHPERTSGSWEDFDAVFAAHDWSSSRIRELEEEFVPKREDRIDLDRLDRPLAGETYGGLDDVQSRVIAYGEADLYRSADPEWSSDAAVFSALLSVYATVGELVRTERLSSETVARDVEGWLHSFFSFVASGPPPERLEQMLALARAGVIRFLGPDTRFGTDDGQFVARSSSQPDVVHARAYIEARLPIPSIEFSGDALLRTLHARGAVREIRASATSPAKLAVDGHSRLVDAHGNAHPRRFAVGPWVAGHTWSGAFPRPGINAGFFRHNDAVAEGLLS
ncbi:adenylate cyclase [Rhodococcoides trifolii]|uniref:Adenylate cyclase n=1 Tax=Rhodococcoides trifolii TaxID=908250 RepID=A0A917FQ88_9NOCA|nr:FAD/NAD(P)-binding protein [Rhodococcus trifolii]GGF94329.1 adenylate cyclase [Rhodococcus trifolii]